MPIEEHNRPILNFAECLSSGPGVQPWIQTWPVQEDLREDACWVLQKPGVGVSGSELWAPLVGWS